MTKANTGKSPEARAVIDGLGQSPDSPQPTPKIAAPQANSHPALFGRQLKLVLQDRLRALED
jgi:hypothetical protein